MRLSHNLPPKKDQRRFTVEQHTKSEVTIDTEPVPIPVDVTSPTTPSQAITRLLAAEWDTIAGLVAAAFALTAHWLHITSKDLLLPIAVGLIALLFIRSLRRERRTTQAFYEVNKSLNLLLRIWEKLAQQESIVNHDHVAANERLALLRSIEAKQVTKQDLKTHNLSFQIDRIEQSLANTLIKTKWEETRENIENLAHGRILVPNRADIFTYKEKALDQLGKGEQFRSTVIPMDLDEPVAYEDDHFEGYQTKMFEFAAGSRGENRVRRLYIFRDQQQFDVPKHWEHMQLMADHDVEVRYLILSLHVKREENRDRIAHADYAIFGELFYARFDPDKRLSVIDTDQNRIANAIEDFKRLWDRAVNQSIQRREAGA